MLIVEDIVDSGLTLQYLLRNLGARNPASLEVCALLTKPSRRKVELPIRFTGFEIPDRSRSATGSTTRTVSQPSLRRRVGDEEEHRREAPRVWPSPANPRGCLVRIPG